MPRWQVLWCKHASSRPPPPYLGPVGPKWAPCWPHEPCYQGVYRIALAARVICRNSRGDCPFVALHSTDLTVGGSEGGFSCGRFLYISTLDGYGTKPKPSLCSRIRKLSSKNRGIFRYNPLSIKAVIPYILLACQNHRHSGVAYGRRKKSVATARADVIVCAKHHQSGDRSLYCIAFWIVLATRIGSPDGVGQFFTRIHPGRHVNIYHCGSISFGHGWRIAIVSLWRPGCPAPSNKREVVGVCHGNLATMHGFAWGAFCGHDSS